MGDVIMLVIMVLMAAIYLWGLYGIVTAAIARRKRQRAVVASANSRAFLGAWWLDAKVPDWWTRIDVETLDISDGARCILGQLFGRYSAGIVKFDLDITDSQAMGFMPTATDYRNGHPSTLYLKEAWEHEIIERQLDSAMTTLTNTP